MRREATRFQTKVEENGYDLLNLSNDEKFLNIQWHARQKLMQKDGPESSQMFRVTNVIKHYDKTRQTKVIVKNYP